MSRRIIVAKTNCFATNPGVFFGLLYPNGVELVGSTLYGSFELVARIYDALKVEEHSEHNLHIRSHLSSLFF